MTKAKLGENIVARLADIQGLSPQGISHGDDFQLPRLIGVGDGRTLQITKEIDELISALAAELKLARPASRKVVKQREWRSWVRSATGPVLARLDLSRPFAETGAELVAAVEAAVDEQLAGLPGREHAFGVTLFGDPGVPPFTIGPVTFEDTNDWLTRKTEERDLTPVTARRLRKTFRGGSVAKRKPGASSVHELSIVSAIARAPYVASVRIEGFGSDAGLEAAATAARLALVVVALQWPVASRALEGMRLRFDAKHYLQQAITFIPGRLVIGGSRLRGTPFGPSINVEDWVAELPTAAPVFGAAGEAIGLLTSIGDASPRLNLLRALVQALQWFYAGCREESDAIAVVNFMASLDALAGGTRAKGILELLEARFRLKRVDPIHPGGPSFKSTVEELYNSGRSRLVHGTSEWIGHDFTERRALAEELARLALLECLYVAGSNPHVILASQLKK
ncbi:hypothetical protein ACFODL_18620 [Phenylobacterium terrae]|uniref:Apea-like HEPN domain-containing protein n=1 Tax=Phenylobacterium terrae TaxID=2665495 RepID=A0ABW4N0Q6_9CAUL